MGSAAAALFALVVFAGMGGMLFAELDLGTARLAAQLCSLVSDHSSD